MPNTLNRKSFRDTQEEGIEISVDRSIHNHTINEGADLSVLVKAQESASNLFNLILKEARSSEDDSVDLKRASQLAELYNSIASEAAKRTESAIRLGQEIEMTRHGNIRDNKARDAEIRVSERRANTELAMLVADAIGSRLEKLAVMKYTAAKEATKK